MEIKNPGTYQRSRSPCPIACTLDLIGDRWTLLIIRDLFLGRSHYREFLESPEGIATNILSSRLKHLVDAGLVETRDSNQRKNARSYHLTAKGMSLKPVVESVVTWGLEQIPNTRLGMASK
jgi:DNA-binding HxlR family transcriptional regulator